MGAGHWELLQNHNSGGEGTEKRQLNLAESMHHISLSPVGKAAGSSGLWKLTGAKPSRLASRLADIGSASLSHWCIRNHVAGTWLSAVCYCPVRVCLYRITKLPWVVVDGARSTVVCPCPSTPAKIGAFWTFSMSYLLPNETHDATYPGH